MDKISLWMHVSVVDWIAERMIIASNNPQQILVLILVSDTTLNFFRLTFKSWIDQLKLYRQKSEVEVKTKQNVFQKITVNESMAFTVVRNFTVKQIHGLLLLTYWVN